MPSQAVTLLFAERPSFNFSDLARRAEEIAGDEFDYPTFGNYRESFQIFHRNHQVRYVDGNLMPSLTAFLTTGKATDVENYRSIIEQSWGCNNAEDLVRSARYSLLMTEMMADGLDPRVRLSLFHDILQAAIEIAQPQAIVFHHSQQVIAAF